MSGVLKKRRRSGAYEPYEFFLFTDLLLYASKFASGLKLHTQIPIGHQFFFQDLPPSIEKGDEYLFQVRSCVRVRVRLMIP